MSLTHQLIRSLPWSALDSQVPRCPMKKSFSAKKNSRSNRINSIDLEYIYIYIYSSILSSTHFTSILSRLSHVDLVSLVLSSTATWASVTFHSVPSTGGPEHRARSYFCCTHAHAYTRERNTNGNRFCPEEILVDALAKSDKCNKVKLVV